VSHQGDVVVRHQLPAMDLQTPKFTKATYKVGWSRVDTGACDYEVGVLRTDSGAGYLRGHWPGDQRLRTGSHASMQRICTDYLTEPRYAAGLKC